MALRRPARGGKEEQIGGNKELLSLKRAFQNSGKRHDNGNDQEVDRSHPLNSVSGQDKLFHQDWEGNIHRRFHQDAAEGHQARG